MRRNGHGPLAIGFHFVFPRVFIAPMVVVCLVAFTDKATCRCPRDGLSLRWFMEILDHPEFIDAFWYSIYLAFGSATLAVILAVPAAIATARYKFPGRGLVMAFFMSPLMIPRTSCSALLSSVPVQAWLGRHLPRARRLPYHSDHALCVAPGARLRNRHG